MSSRHVTHVGDVMYTWVRHSVVKTLGFHYFTVCLSGWLSVCLSPFQSFV